MLFITYNISAPTTKIYLNPTWRSLSPWPIRTPKGDNAVFPKVIYSYNQNKLLKMQAYGTY
jgi:hypothetical protein